MAKKLAIGNVVEFTVKFNINNGGKSVAHAVTLICKRLPEAELQERVKQDGLSMNDIMTEVTTGWKDQRIVVEEDGTPSEFDEEGMQMLLTLPHAGRLSFIAYAKECGAKEKN